MPDLPQPGQPAPSFKARTSDGEPFALEDLHGQPAVLFFYPKADTPGCTAQACAFRDDSAAYRAAGVQVVGISPDTVDDQNAFQQKYDLPYPLVADHGHAVCELYGVWGTHAIQLPDDRERSYTGVLRSCFILDADGVITHVFEGVDAQLNSQMVRDALGL